MQMNLDPGWDKTIINVGGPCKLDITNDGSTIVEMEIPSGEAYKLIVQKTGKKPEYFVTEAAGYTT